MKMYVVVGSATSAERLRKTAEKRLGIPAYVVRTPAPIRTGGCSYSVKIDDRAANMIKQTALETGISYKGIYIEKKRNGVRVFDVIS